MIRYIRRATYFLYYLMRLDWAAITKYSNVVRDQTGQSRVRQWCCIIRDSLKFNVSITEFYQFRFFEKDDSEKKMWAGTGTMYEFQRLVNPKESRATLSDKREFYRSYRRYFRHELFSLSELSNDLSGTSDLLDQNDVLVLKEATGNCGAGIEFLSLSGLTVAELLEYMMDRKFDLAETLAVQHAVLNALSPSAVNTIRVFTQITRKGEYQVLGCRLRISVDSPVDNLAAGNMAAPIDPETGCVIGPGVYSDITRESSDIHPVTGIEIIGLKIPFWTETMEMVKDASLLHPENRSVGWDVIVTDNGPGLIEGNHDWCKLVWQLPVNQGLKHLLDFTT